MLNRPASFLLSTAATMLLTGLQATPAHADVIRSPTSVVLNTMGEYGPNFQDTDVIDQSGLSAGFTSGTSDFDTYLASNPTHEGNSLHAWYGSLNVVTGSVGYDLGASHSITRLALWNIGNNDDIPSIPFGSNVRGFEVYTSAVGDFSAETLVGSFVAGSGSVGFLKVGAQVFDVTDSVGRYVRLRITSNYGATHATGFGELAFATAAPPPPSIPEPSTVMLLAAGMMAVVSRRRR